MISTKGLELTNFINPDLTWKTVSKGYRSATRRSRKQVDRSPKSDADPQDKGTESPSDTTVSESEKLGVAVLGQRFREKVEHVPIKKRRFTVRPPSPPRYFTPQKKDQDQVVEAKKSCQKSNSKKQLFPMNASTRRRKQNHIYSEDFSGIEILAAAACNNNMGDDVNRDDNLVVGKLSIMATSVEERILSKETTHSSQTDTVFEVAKERPLFGNADGNLNIEEGDQKNATDEKTVRLHWDLNVEMDDWETPCGTDSCTDEKLQVLEACELEKETRNSSRDVATPVPTIVDHVEQKVEPSSCIDSNEDKRVSTTDKALESFGVVAETSQNSPSPVSETAKASESSEGTAMEMPIVNLGVKQVEDENLEIALPGENGDLKLSTPPVRRADEAGSGSTEPGNEVAPKAESNGEEQDDSSGRVGSEDTKDESLVLNASDKDRNSKGFDTGYDSQYEDGELRESDAPPYWEEDYEECVDYGSDTCDDAAVAFSMPSKLGLQLDCNEEEFRGRERSADRTIKAERVFGFGYDGVCDHISPGDGLRQKPMGLKVKLSGSDEFPRGSETSPNRIAEVSEGCVIRKHTADGLDGFDGKDSPANVVGSGASWKELPGIGESLSSDTSNRNDSVLVQRSRSSNLDFYAQSEEARADHSLGKERSDLQIHPKSPVGLANPSVSYWDSRHRESPTFRGSFGSDRSRTRSGVESRGGYPMHSEGVGGVSGPDSYGHRQTMNSFSNGSYRYPTRRRSPGNNNNNNNRDDSHNTHRGMLPVRDGSPDRRRFRRYPQGVGRGFREYHQRQFPPSDSDEYSHHVPNRMVRRDQNSPPPNRGPVHYRRPYKRSQSRSRSRSPGSWIVSRDQHEAPKHRGNSSRSPDFRFEPRMQRMRLPFQKQNFGAKYEVGFVSPQRRRFSPQHNNNNNNCSRWFDDQNGGADNFRGRRVPARPFQQGQRFDSVGSSRRMNSDDFYEPAMRPAARFSDMGRGRGGGGSGNRRYDGSDDERRRPDGGGGGRYEMYPRVKRCDSDGLRRARFDEEDSFVSRNNNNNNSNNYNDSDTNNNGNSVGERRPRNVYMGELVKRKAT